MGRCAKFLSVLLGKEHIPEDIKKEIHRDQEAQEKEAKLQEEKRKEEEKQKSIRYEIINEYDWGIRIYYTNGHNRGLWDYDENNNPTPMPYKKAKETFDIILEAINEQKKLFSKTYRDDQIVAFSLENIETIKLVKSEEKKIYKKEIIEVEKTVNIIEESSHHSNDS